MSAAGLIPRVWLAVPLLFLAAVAVAPAWRLLAEGASAGDAAWLGVWADPFWRGRLLWSLAQAAVAMVLALALVLPVAWVLARRAFPGRALALRLLMLPFVVPTLVAAIGVLALWGPRGWPGAWLAEAGMPLDETPWLLLYGNLFFNLCLVVRAGVEALERVDGHRVAAARTLGQRLVERLGEPVATPWPDLQRLFPSPATLAQAEGEVLGQLGIVRQRQAAIVALARAVDSGQLALHPGADVAATTQALCQLPGIGDWTAQYIALRALRWPDAWPAGDVALAPALGLPEHRSAAARRAAERLSAAWRPWRSYAVIRTWAGLHARAETSKD